MWLCGVGVYELREWNVFLFRKFDTLGLSVDKSQPCDSTYMVWVNCGPLMEVRFWHIFVKIQVLCIHTHKHTHTQSVIHTECSQRSRHSSCCSNFDDDDDVFEDALRLAKYSYQPFSSKIVSIATKTVELLSTISISDTLVQTHAFLPCQSHPPFVCLPPSLVPQ